MGFFDDELLPGTRRYQRADFCCTWPRHSLRLLCGDCLDVMREIESDSFDLTVTSPPYDDLRSYNKTLSDWNEESWQAIIGELYRLTKPGGIVVWVVGDATVDGSESGTSFKQALHAKQVGFNLHDTMIYQKANPGGARGGQTRYLQAFEYMFIFAKGAPRTLALIYDRKNITPPGTHRAGGRDVDGVWHEREITTQAYGRRLNVWRIANAAVDLGHPAVFPEPLARDHVLSWSKRGDHVFDPFAGAGTTGKAALMNGRNFTGIERDADYFAIASQRLARANPFSGA